MIRSLSLVLLGLMVSGARAQDPVKPVDLKFAGQIVESDGKDKVRNLPCKIHVVKLQKGRTYVIDMVCNDGTIDPYLRLEDSAGKELAEDDDGGGDLNARVTFVCPKDDTYKIIATTFGPAEGAYILTVRDGGGPAQKDPLKKDPLKKDPLKKDPLKKDPPKKDVPKKDVPQVDGPALAKKVGPEPIKLGALTPQKKWIEIEGKLKNGDAIDPEQKQLSKVYSIEFQKGASYQIDMKSTDFDSFLRLLEPDGLEVAKDDDSGGDLNSKIEFKATAEGTHFIVATSFNGGAGDFLLKVALLGGGKDDQKVPLKKEDPKKAGGKLDATKLFTPTERKATEAEGTIKAGDPVDPVRQNPSKAYEIELADGIKYQIDVSSTEFDTYLLLIDGKGKLLAEDDDGGGDLNSRLVFVPPAKGTYRIVVTSFEGGVGDFTLKIKALGAGKAAGKAEGNEDVRAVKLDAPTEKKPVEVDGKIQDGDRVDPVRKQAAKFYDVELTDGGLYQIDMISDDFDAYLRILDSKGKELAQDDDSGGDLHARIVFGAPAKGIYRIVATSFNGGAGAFALKIKSIPGKSVKFDSETVHAVTGPLIVSGRLTQADPKDVAKEDSPCQVTLVKLVKGKTYVVDLASKEMDSFLRIENAKKKQLAEDDDSGGGLDSRLTFTPEEDGVYRLIATNLDGVEGNYRLTIREEK